jgi:hypothetical protein
MPLVYASKSFIVMLNNLLSLAPKNTIQAPKEKGKIGYDMVMNMEIRL